MPSWITHFVTVNKICERVKIENKNDFLFGNVMPDILNNYIVKNTSVHKNYDETHFRYKANLNGIRCELPDLDRFYNEYKGKMDNPVVLGYYTHLITDFYWNSTTYSNYFKPDGDCLEFTSVEGEKVVLEYNKAIKVKQLDFAIFTRIFEEKL